MGRTHGEGGRHIRHADRVDRRPRRRCPVIVTTDWAVTIQRESQALFAYDGTGRVSSKQVPGNRRMTGYGSMARLARGGEASLSLSAPRLSERAFARVQ